MLDLTKELDPQQIAFGRSRFMLALDTVGEKRGLVCARNLLPILSGVKMPDFGHHNAVRLSRAVKGILNNDGEYRDLLVDRAAYAQSSYLFPREVDPYVENATIVTISGAMDKAVLSSLKKYFDDKQRTVKIYVAGASPEMEGVSNMSISAAELCLQFGFDGIVCRAVDVPRLTAYFGEALEDKEIVATGLSNAHRNGRMTAAEALAAGAHRVVFGKELREAQNPTSMMVDQIMAKIDLSEFESDKVSNI